jgi:hypothetical protein
MMGSFVSIAPTVLCGFGQDVAEAVGVIVGVAGVPVGTAVGVLPATQLGNLKEAIRVRQLRKPVVA